MRCVPLQYNDMITSLYTDAARLYTNSDTSYRVRLEETTSVTPPRYEGIPNNISNLRAFDDPNAGKDTVELSNEAKNILEEKTSHFSKKEKKEEKDSFKEETASARKEKELQPGELSPEEKKAVEELKKTDRRVKAHEQAHKSAGGQYILSGVNLQYTTGPDGNRYAVGGEVKIDVGEVPDDPDATIRKMEIVRRAALAPQDPSPQDRRVAAEASQKAAAARAEAAGAQGSADPVEEARKALTEEKSPLEELRSEPKENSFNPEADTYYRNSQENTAPGFFFELVA